MVITHKKKTIKGGTKRETIEMMVFIMKLSRELKKRYCGSRGHTSINTE